MLTKAQVNTILYFCEKDVPIYLHKIFKMLYFYEIIYFQNTGKRFLNFTFIADARFQLPKEFWADLVSGQFEEKNKDKFKIFCPNKNKGYTINDIMKMKIIALTDELDDNLRWTEQQFGLMQGVKFKFEGFVPSQMTERFATGTNFWMDLVRSGNANTIINFEDSIVPFQEPKGKKNKKEDKVTA